MFAISRGQGTGYNEWLRRALADTEGFVTEAMATRLFPAVYLDEKTDGQVYTAARREGIAFQRRLRAVFEAVDVLILPTIRTIPPERGTIESADELFQLLGNNVPFNIVGTPAVSVPITTVNGIPVSAQVIAPEFKDELALQTAQLLQEVGDHQQ